MHSLDYAINEEPFLRQEVIVFQECIERRWYQEEKNMFIATHMWKSVYINKAVIYNYIYISKNTSVYGS